MIININKDRLIQQRKFVAGTMNENNSTDLIFVFDEELKGYAKRIVFITPDGRKPSAVIEDDTYTIKNDITKYNKVKAYLLLTKEGNVDWRSVEMEKLFNHNKKQDGTEVTEEQTDLWTSMVNILNDKITTVDNLSIEIQNLITDITTKLNNGEFNGADGLTPYIKDGFWYIGETNTNVKAEVKSILSIEKTNTTNSIDEYTITFTDNTEFIYYIQNGKDYVLTDNDKQNIANQTKSLVEADIQSTLNNNLKEAKNYTDNAIVRDFKDITFNETTMTFLFTRHDNTTFTVDLPIEQTVKNGYYDAETKELVLVLVSGQEIKIPASGLISDYDGVDSATIQCVVSADNKITCNIIAGSISKTLLTTELQEEINGKLNKADITEMPLLATYEDGKQETMRMVVFK